MFHPVSDLSIPEFFYSSIYNLTLPFHHMLPYFLSYDPGHCFWSGDGCFFFVVFIFPRVMHLFQLPVGGAPACASPTGKQHLRVTSTSANGFSAETASPTGESCNMVWFEGHQACQPKPPLAAYLKFQPRIISVAP